MLVERRAIYQIQTELKKIALKCNFEHDWTPLCVQFFSKNESKIEYVSPTYKIFSLGLLFYIIRKHNIPITMEFFSIHVLRKNNVRQKAVHPVYVQLCEKFGDPIKVNFKTIANATINFLNESISDFHLIETEQFESEFVKPMKSRTFSKLLHSYQDKPKLFTKNKIHELVVNAFCNMKLL